MLALSQFQLIASFDSRISICFLFFFLAWCLPKVSVVSFKILGRGIHGSCKGCTCSLYYLNPLWVSFWSLLLSGARVVLPVPGYFLSTAGHGSTSKMVEVI